MSNSISQLRNLSLSLIFSFFASFWKKHVFRKKKKILDSRMQACVIHEKFNIGEIRSRENDFAANILKLRANIYCIGSSGGFSRKGGYPQGVKRNRNGENVGGSPIPFDFSRVNIIPPSSHLVFALPLIKPTFLQMYEDT